MPVGCYKQMSAIKEGVIMRMQYFKSIPPNHRIRHNFCFEYYVQDHLSLVFVNLLNES